MALCKYRAAQKYYDQLLKYFFPNDLQIQKQAANDQAFEDLENMLQSSIGARQAMDLLPHVPNFLPTSPMFFVAQFGYGVALATHAQICLPTGWLSKNSKACLLFKKPSVFMEKMWGIKAVLRAEYKDIILADFTTGDTGTCAADSQ
jgi:hypothetical protein